MDSICKLCVHSNIDVNAHPCNGCGYDFNMFKYDEQQLATAHREGWEQGRAEILTMLKDGSMFYDDTTAIEADIARMEYGGKANDNCN